MKTNIRILSVFVSVCCFLLFQISSIGAEDKKPFRTVGAMTLSGVAGAVPETGWGVSDAADYINKTGGIHGRAYKALIEDGRYDVPTTIGIFNKYLESWPEDEYLFYCQFNTPALKALQEKVNEVKIPVMAGSMSARIFDDKVRKNAPYYFATGAGYGEMWGMVLKYIKEHHKKKTPARVAFHYYDNSTGTDPIPELERYAKKFGVEIVMKEPFAPTAQTFAPSFMKFKKSNIEYVLFWNWSIKTGVRYFNEAKKYIPDIPTYGAHWTAGNLWFDLCGKDYDNHYVVSAFPLETEIDNKFVQLVTKTVKEKNRDVKVWSVYMQSWMMGLIPAIAARQLLDDGKPLTRNNLRDAIENLRGWDMMGMYGGKIFDYTSHKWSRARMLRSDWSKKSLIPMTDWVDLNDYLK